MCNQDLNPPTASSTLQDFGRRHSFSATTVYRMIRDGELAVTKIRGLSRILLEDELAWLDAIKASGRKATIQAADRSGGAK